LLLPLSWCLVELLLELDFELLRREEEVPLPLLLCFSRLPMALSEGAAEDLDVRSSLCDLDEDEEEDLWPCLLLLLLLALVELLGSGL